MTEQVPLKMDAETLARHCVTVCEERKAADILLFDVREQSILADFYLVCSGNSMPQVRAIAEHIRLAMHEHGLLARGRDGGHNSQWVVMDYGVIMVHILMPELRRYYCLEDLWDKRKVIYQGGVPLPPQRPGAMPAPRPPHQLPRREEEDREEG
jgi:ribosome-associated protein